MNVQRESRRTGKDNRPEGESLNVLGWVSPTAIWLGAKGGGGSLRQGRRKHSVRFFDPLYNRISSIDEHVRDSLAVDPLKTDILFPSDEHTEVITS